MKPKPMAAAKRPESGELKRLAAELGSPRGLDPIPPDQYLTFMEPHNPESLRLWAWVLSKTIRLGHRSASCVDERGRALSLADAARELAMDAGSVRRAWRWIESQGKVRRTGGRLFCAGEIVKGEEKAGRAVQPLPPFLRLLSPELRQQIEALPKERRGELTAKLEQMQAKRYELQREAMAYARYVSDLEIDTVCESFGLRRHTGPPRPTPAAPFPLLTREQMANELVQPAGGTLPKNGRGSPAPSILTSESLREPIPLPPFRKRKGELKETPETECKRCQGSGLVRYTITPKPGEVRSWTESSVKFCSCAAGEKLESAEPGAAAAAARTLV